MNDRDRLANLVATLAVALADRVRSTTELAAGHSAAAPAALVALHQFLDRPSIDELRDVVGLTHSGAVRLVERLVDSGLVRREPGRDGRSAAITLTSKGARVATRIAAARRSAVNPVLDALTDDERAALTAAAEKLLAAVTTDRLAMRARGEPASGGWLCRLCDFDACGRSRGLCPTFNTASGAGRDGSTARGSSMEAPRTR
jgi:DNA-binding MarR family transcriptional regulator